MADTTIRGITREVATPTGAEHIEGEDVTGSFKMTLLASTAGLDAAVIKTKYESNANTEAFTTTEKGKLADIDDDANLYVHPDHTGDVTSTGDGAQTIAANAVTNAKIADNAVNAAKIADGSVTNTELANMTADTLKGRQSTTGAPQDLTAAQARTLLNVEDGANAYVHGNHTGEVTSVGDGPQTIVDGVVTNAKLANMVAETIKMRTLSTGAPQDLRIENLPDDATPVGGDVLLGQKSGGALVKIDIANLPTGGGGEANDGTNLGTGQPVYAGKSGVSLQFRSLLATSASSIVLASLANEITFQLDGDAANPGNSQYYGTDGTGTKGFHALPAAGVTDHGALTGLADDDHTQYHTDARGDARYSQLGHTHAAADITSGTFLDARIAQSNVTQHQAALSLTESQITDLGPYAPSVHTHVEADITDLGNYVPSDPTGGGSAIVNMFRLTQAQYDALTPDANTFYVIVG